MKQTFNVQLYQEIVTRMTEAWLVIYISVDILDNLYLEISHFLGTYSSTRKLLIKTVLSILIRKFILCCFRLSYEANW